MERLYSIVKRKDGLWETKNIKTKKVSGPYTTKVVAVNEAQKIIRQGVTVIVHGTNGKVQKVLGVRELAKKAPVKRRLTNKEVNRAIASVLDI